MRENNHVRNSDEHGDGPRRNRIEEFADDDLPLTGRGEKKRLQSGTFALATEAICADDQSHEQANRDRAGYREIDHLLGGNQT